MKKLGGVLLVVLLGACDAAPERITAPEDAERGGFTLGSGNRGNVLLLPADTTVLLDATTTETKCTEERGGYMYGSGHLVDAPSCPTP